MSRKTHQLLLAGILLLGAILLFIHLGQYDVWGDEALTFPKGHDAGQVLKYLRLTGGVVHPPLYSLVQFFWERLVGMDTAANRIIWAFFGWINLLLVYFSAKEIFNRKVALISVLLCATSPFLVMYSRMIRYYSLTTLAVLLVIWSFARLRRTGRKPDWLFFTFSSVLLLYEDYLGFFVLIFLYLYLLFHFQIFRARIAQWLLTPAVVFVLFLPWMPTLFAQIGTNKSPYPEHEAKVVQEAPRVAQKAVGIRGLVVNSVMKAGFLYYIFTLGETTYFWRWWITLPVLAVYSLLFILVWRRIRGPDGKQAGWLAFTLIGVAIATIVFSEIYAIFGSRMFQFPSKVMFLLPLFILLISWSWEGLRNQTLKFAVIILLLAGNAYGMSNYFSGRQFLNPKFLVPWRQVQRDIHAVAHPQDLILTDEEAFVHQLKISTDSLEEFGLVGALDKVSQVLQQRGSHQVFLIIRYRGDETITTEGLIVLDELKKLYPLIETRNYVPMDPDAARFWERLLRKKPNPYVVDVYRFQVAALPSSEANTNMETDHAGKTRP